MGCEIKLLTKANSRNEQQGEAEFLSDGKTEVRTFDVGETAEDNVSRSELSIGTVTDMVMDMSMERRTQLADFLRDSMNVKLTEADIQNLNLIGNMTVADVFSSFGLKREWIPLSDETLGEHLNILKCRKLSLQGRTVSGRVVDGLGREVYVLNNVSDAENFLYYLRAKDAIRIFGKNKPEKLAEVYDRHSYELRAIKDKFFGMDSSVTESEMMFDFLDNVSKYKSFKRDGKMIDTRSVFNTVYYELTGEYYKEYIAKHDAFENDVLAIIPDKYNYNELRLPKAELYEVFSRHIDGFGERYSMDDFVQMDKDELDELFYGSKEKGTTGIFANHRMLSTSSIKDVGATTRSKEGEGGTKKEEHAIVKVSVPESFVKESWNAIKSGAADEEVKEVLQSESEKTRKVKIEGKNKTEKYTGEKYDTYNEFKKDNGITAKEKARLIDKAGYVFNDQDGVQRVLHAEYETKVVDEEAVKKDKDGNTVIDEKTGRPVKEKTGRKVTNEIIKFYFERARKSAGIGRINSSYITLKTPYELAGKKYGFGYDTEYVLSAVDGIDLGGEYGVLKNGMYHGMYVYYYTNPETGRKEYVISRDVMSPEAGISTYHSLEMAVKAIDRMNERSKLMDRALIELKLHQNGVPRYLNDLELGHVNKMQVLTVLDYNLNPKIPFSRLDNVYKSLFEMSGKKFHERFDEETNGATKVLYTPEMMSTFLMKMYDEIYVKNKKFNPTSAQTKDEAVEKIIDVYKKNPAQYSMIIEQISRASVKNYFVEEAYSRSGSGSSDVRLRELVENGVTLDVKGDRFSNNGRKIGEFVTGAINKGIDFIKTSYNVDVVKTNSQQIATEQLYKDLGLSGKADAVRAFVHDGKIYINTSVATAADLWHEVSHLFLGALKATDFQKYELFLESFQKKGSQYYNNFTTEYASVNRRSEYKNMARTDKVEEAVARTIGNYLYNNVEFGNIYETDAGSAGKVGRFLKSAAGFNEEVYENVMSDIISCMKSAFNDKSLMREGNQLGFTKLMNYLSGMSSGKGAEAIDYSTATNIVRQLLMQNPEIEKC